MPDRHHSGRRRRRPVSSHGLRPPSALGPAPTIDEEQRALEAAWQETIGGGVPANNARTLNFLLELADCIAVDDQRGVLSKYVAYDDFIAFRDAADRRLG
ncbi:unannotated protein [freshwater metagenome]|uniref:Unannotated protein n=1 Tax=freshwater metagenome TaxID=449393 RepID=A0A6J7J7Y2_9ZZZZ|nr:hypothetical protein [Actinomycetota bacterium]